MRKRQLNKPVSVVTVLAAIIVGLRVLSGVIAERTGTVDPHIALSQAQATEVIERQRQMHANAFGAVSDGEVSRTEERVRQATALATATSLFAASESLNGRTPSTVVSIRWCRLRNASWNIGSGN